MNFHNLALRLPLTLFTFSVFLFLAPSVVAQQITSAQARKNQAWNIVVAFDASFLPSESAKKPENYTLTDLRGIRTIKIKEVVINTDDAIRLVLDNTEELNPADRYHLDIEKLTFPGIKAEDVPSLEKRITFPDFTVDPATGKPALTAQKRKRWRAGDADDREGSNIYASISITKTRTKDAVKSVDLLIDTPVVFNTNPIQRLGPLFELEIGDPQGSGDPDSLKAGASWKIPIQPESLNNSPIIGFQERNDFFFESDRRFDNVNFVWSNRFTLVSKTYFGKMAKFRFTIPIGNEMGVNLSSPIKEAEHRFIDRPFVGFFSSLVFPLQKPAMRRIGFEFDYIRRFPLRREITFDVDEDDNLIVKSFGKNPREYIKAKLNFDFNKAFGIAVGYEYGQKPPLYKLVDSKFTVGLTYKIKLERNE